MKQCLQGTKQRDAEYVREVDEDDLGHASARVHSALLSILSYVVDVLTASSPRMLKWTSVFDEL